MFKWILLNSVLFIFSLAFCSYIYTINSKYAKNAAMACGMFIVAIFCIVLVERF